MPTTLRRALAAALLALAPLAAAPAHAQTSLSKSLVLTNATPLVTYTFTVTSAGNFDIFSDAPTIDPVIFLFSGTNVTDPNAFLARNDDSCQNFAFCQPSGSYSNGLIQQALTVGTYTVAGAQCCTRVEHVQQGTVSFNGSAPYTINVTSANGTVAATSTVPEPATWALMGTGLLGLVGVARRRRMHA